MTKLLDEQAQLQDKIDAADAWNLDRHVELAMDALRVPPRRRRDQEPLRRREAPRRAVPAAAVAPGHAHPRRADEPPRRRVGGVARAASCTTYPGTVVAVTHDRYFLDNVAEWILELDRGRGLPFKGNYSGWLEQKSARLAHEEKPESARQRKLKQELEWVQASPRARQAKSKARLAAYDALVDAVAEGPADPDGDLDPARTAPRRSRDRGRRASARRSATSSSSTTSRSSCRAPASSASSARTAPARRRSSR